MPRCLNRAVKATPTNVINALEAFMRTRSEASFDELRQNVPLLQPLGDGEMKQAIQDADLEHDESP